MTDWTKLGTIEGLYDAQGRFVPRELVSELDLTRHELVHAIVADARRVETELAKFKTETLSNINAFASLSAEQYSAPVGGQRGNITLLSYDGRFKVVRQIADRITFDERLQAAKALIDACLARWTANGPAEVRAVVEHAFQVDKAGRISTERMFSLKKLTIEDEEWGRAMRAISDSVRVESTSTYVRVYERVGDSQEWRPIALDLAAVRTEP